MALAAVGLATGALLPASGDTRGRATFLGTFVWEGRWDGFGGFSAIEVADDGVTFTTLSDRVELVSGHLSRDARGVVTGVEVGPPRRLINTDGKPLRGRPADSEGLAIGRDGTVWISFEGRARVRREGGEDESPVLLPSHPDFERLRLNSSLEALAVDDRDRLYTIPERPFRSEGSFRVYRFENDSWDIVFHLPARDGFAVAGADIGPDGRLYVLERDFTGLGFRTRLRRVNLDGSGEKTLLTTATGTFDNLEGIAVWADGSGLRATMISDDNLRFFQQTQIVDYRLPD